MPAPSSAGLTDRMGLPIREKNMKTSFLQKAYEVDVITSTWGPAFHTNSDTSVKFAQNLAAYTLDKYLWVNRMHRTPPATVGFLAPAERTHFWSPHMLAQPPHGHYPFFLLVHSVLCPSTHTLSHRHRLQSLPPICCSSGSPRHRGPPCDLQCVKGSLASGC